MSTFPKDYVMAVNQYKKNAEGSPPVVMPDRLPNVVNYKSIITSDESNREATSNAMKRQLFKTKFCRHCMKGSCRYGNDCTYAHCYEELAARPNFYKTKICTRPNCNDADCQYAHSIYELHDFFSKVPEKVCPAFLMGACKDLMCPMSHNKIQAGEMMLARCFNILSDDGTKKDGEAEIPTLESLSDGHHSRTRSSTRQPAAPNIRSATLAYHGASSDLLHNWH